KKERSDEEIANEHMEIAFAFLKYSTLKSPCNEFIIFRINVTYALKIGGRIRNASEISSLAANMWQKWPPEKKNKYVLLSKKWSSDIWKDEGVTMNVMAQETFDITPSIINPDTEFYEYSSRIWGEDDAILFKC
ncbi:3762_t:CDS:1, partial [Ambispora leptoticha]